MLKQLLGILAGLSRGDCGDDSDLVSSGSEIEHRKETIASAGSCT